mmetsp:Transcript_40461/g.63159  ORF Transcript_40461/g.63159 Transcript_40461/m.63159 type:complete len:88 (+) Transcript_40461:831-1094(+)
MFLLCPLLFRRKHEYNWRNFWIGLALMFVSFVFFARGLDDRNDYLRINHVIWHILIAASSFFLWRSVLRHLAKLGGKQQPRNPVTNL